MFLPTALLLISFLLVSPIDGAAQRRTSTTTARNLPASDEVQDGTTERVTNLKSDMQFSSFSTSTWTTPISTEPDGQPVHLLNYTPDMPFEVFMRTRVWELVPARSAETQQAEDLANSDENADDDGLDIIIENTAIATSEQLSLGGVSRRLRTFLQRGRDLLAVLPRFLMVVAKTVVERIPTPDDIVSLSKQTLIGMPQELISYAFDSFCASAVKHKAVDPPAERMAAPDPHAVRFVLRPLDGSGDEVRVPLIAADRLWRHRAFRRDWPVVIVVTGWNSNWNETNDALDVLHSAYRCRGGYNFVAVDMAQYVDTLYTWSAVQTAPLGRLLGEALVDLRRLVPAQNVHVVGHSLGAHISGQAGRTYADRTGERLARITGLDPARPCFNEGERLGGLQREDAQFVDVIHTNAGILGQRYSVGDVDFFPNGRKPLQPGCWTIFCAHGRAYEYFAETVRPGQEYNFAATRCNRLSAYRRGQCLGPTVPMGLFAHNGYTTRTNASAGVPRPNGNYFLVTNDASPFGRATLVKPVAQCVQSAPDRR